MSPEKVYFQDWFQEEILIPNQLKNRWKSWEEGWFFNGSVDISYIYYHLERVGNDQYGWGWVRCVGQEIWIRWCIWMGVVVVDVDAGGCHDMVSEMGGQVQMWGGFRNGAHYILCQIMMLMHSGKELVSKVNFL